jgi:hypothetical protein
MNSWNRNRILDFTLDTLTKTISIATKGGFYEIKDYNYLVSSCKDLNGEYTTSLLKLKTGGVLIASQQKGVYIKKNDDCKAIYYQKGTLCSGLDVDERENIWLATNKGIVYLKKEKGNYTIQNITKSDGLQSNEINQIAWYNNYIWYTTNTGLYYFKPQELLNAAIAPKIEIEDFLINGQKANMDSAGVLGYEQNNITVKAICLSFLPGESSGLTYRLIGYDDSWKTSGKDNLINYTNLPAGKYKLEIRGLNNKDLLSVVTRAINFEIKPPFWKTWWFISLEIVSFLMLIALGTFSYINRVRKKENEKSRINQLLNEYQMTALRAQINPHFIFNCISSIQLLILKENIDKAYGYLQKFSKLLRLVLENSKRNFTSLKEELEVVSLYVELEQLRFDGSFRFLKTIEPGIDLSRATVPYMILQPMVENAIWHGLMHSDKVEKIIALNVRKEDSGILIEIEDNGIGRERSRQYKTSSKISMGQNITVERLNLFNEEKQGRASMEIADLQENNIASGTLVKIIIPQQDNYGKN